MPRNYENYKTRPERLCVKCGVTFSGVRCKECTKRRKRQYLENNRTKVYAYNREWAKNNPEKIREYAKNWRMNNPEKYKEAQKLMRERKREQRKVWTAKWKLNNPKRVKQQWVEWRIRNIERLAEYRRKYSELHPELVRARKHTRRIKQGMLTSSIDPDYILFLKDIQNMRCKYCNREMSKYQIDHITPICRGGDNSNDNLQLLCPTCNRRKGSKTDKEFKEYLNALL